MDGSSGKATADGRFGVIYLAFGRPYLAMALNSFLSLRRSNPGVPAAIVTNIGDSAPAIPGWTEEDHWIHIPRPAKDNRLFKTAIIDYSPFDKTLYLDCDTVVVGDLSPARFLLDHFDLGLKLRQGPPGKRDNIKLFDGSVDYHDMPHWNGGVVLFRSNDKTRDFFRNWKARFQALGNRRDQPSLIEALFTSDCRIVSLDYRWNDGDKLNSEGLLAPKAMRDRVVIWHYTRDIDGTLERDLLKAEALIPGSPEAGEADMRQFLAKGKGPGAWRNRARTAIRSAVRGLRGRLTP